MLVRVAYLIFWMREQRLITAGNTEVRENYELVHIREVLNDGRL